MPEEPKGLMGKMVEGVKNIVKPKPDFNEFDIKTDKFESDEQKKIVEMICEDIKADIEVQKDWVEERKKDELMKSGGKPSDIEGLTKKAWQSNRNLGITGAVCESINASLVATCWNPDSIHYVATEKNDIDNKDNRERFAKWAVGKNEMNFTPQADDYVNNKTSQGWAIFKVYYDVWFEWIDRMIPNKGKDGRPNGTYKTEIEKKRFEKVVIENKNDLDDILVPRYGCEIQKLPHIIDTLHLTGDKIQEYSDNKVFDNVDDGLINNLKGIALNYKKKGLEAEKAKQLSINDVTDADMKALPIDVHEWYGYYKKDNKRERYRFRIEKETKTFLSGKPLRKITPDGKYPFVGGPFIRKPGQLKGESLPHDIKDPTNALNSIFNQKQDFQYVTNCPFGFHRAQEGYTKSAYDLEPGISYPTEGNPNESVFFPNIQRSMAWAQYDIELLFQVIEKKTGAASYFLTSESKGATLGRDKIVEAKSQTRFGRWVTGIQDEFCEAISMGVDLYARFAPKNLAERILGEDAKQLFPNFSRETIRYKGDARMEPDIIAGSKAYEKQLMMWGFSNLQQTIWFNPQVNPKGNWLLVRDTMKGMGYPAPDRYMPPEPQAEMGTSRTIDDIWARLMQGEVVEVDPNWNIPEILAGLYKKKGEKYFDLDKEYRPNFDNLIFQVEQAMRMFVKKLAEQAISDNIAKSIIAQNPQGPPQGGQPAPASPEAMPAMEGM